MRGSSRYMWEILLRRGIPEWPRTAILSTRISRTGTESSAWVLSSASAVGISGKLCSTFFASMLR